MCGKQKSCEESQGDVVIVEDVGIIVCAAFPYTQKHLRKQHRADEQIIKQSTII